MKIKIKDLTKSYKDGGRELQIINDLTVDFPEGSSIGIIGKSGIGKSTLMHLLGGLDRPSSGSVELGNTRIESLSSDELSAFRGKHVGFIFQFHNLLPEFSALENVCMPLWINDVPDDEALERATAVLTRVGLADRLNHSPAQLSGGEQQRVAIARALVSKPDLILADEPTGNLDFRTAKDIQDLLLEVQKESKNTLVIVTHSNELARNLDIVFEMHPGGVLQHTKLMV